MKSIQIFLNNNTGILNAIYNTFLELKVKIFKEFVLILFKKNDFSKLNKKNNIIPFYKKKKFNLIMLSSKELL